MLLRGRRMRTLCMLTAASLALAACAGEPEQTAAPQPVEVQVTMVSPQAVEVADELPGRVVAFRTAEIRPQVGGIVQRRFFEQGAFVRAGQPLFQINPAPFRADANSAAAYADRIVALSEGRVVHVGTPGDLMTSTTLEEVFGTPVEVRRDGPYPLAVYYR